MSKAWVAFLVFTLLPLSGCCVPLKKMNEPLRADFYEDCVRTLSSQNLADSVCASYVRNAFEADGMTGIPRQKNLKQCTGIKAPLSDESTYRVIEQYIEYMQKNDETGGCYYTMPFNVNHDLANMYGCK